MKACSKYALLSALSLAMVLPSVSYATNGYFLIGFGQKSRAMGGTGVAYNMGGMAAAFNPATMVDSENEFDMGVELFNPPRAVYHDSNTLGYTDEEARRNYFLIPSMGLTWKYTDDMTLGFAFIGAGLQTSFNQSITSSSCSVQNARVAGSCPPTGFNANLGGASGEFGVELMQMQMLPSISYKLNEQHSVGATLVIAAQYFRAEGLGDFVGLSYAGNNPTKGATGISDEGWDYSFGGGIRLGWLGKFMENDLNIGVNYSSRTYMSEFERYSNLFAEQGDFDIPENYAIGFAYKGIKDFVLAFDVQRINYSDVAAIGNPGPLASNPVQFFPLCPIGSDTDPCRTGGDKGLGFGWTDQTIYKVGADWLYSQKFNFRAGINYGKSPIPDDQVLFNMIAPATPELAVTLGMRYVMSDTYILDFNFMHAFENTIKGPTAFGPGGVVEGSNASIAMSQTSIGAGLAIKF
ncbi:MAG: outer membrane protein transport protein [Methylococcales bacterium]